jgi:glycosyltransferase involved in cell wall biosynthesis
MVHLGIVLPCYNEEAILPDTVQVLMAHFDSWIKANKITPNSVVCFVDDGSRDGTWALIEQFSEQYSAVEGIKLSTNFGHQNALVAGMLENRDRFDCLITMDADLQDDVQIIEQMLDKYTDGNVIVYALRNDRETDSWFKRFTATAFYRLMSALNVRTFYNHADFRLLDNRVLHVLAEYREVHLFLRGLFPIMGFKSDVVYFKRLARTKGETKYPLRKMLGFAWNGITSFSAYPMKLILGIGFLTFLLSAGIGFWALFAFFTGKTVPGWTSIVVPIFLFGGLQMVALGIIGEYIGKIYMEVKARPRYLVDEHIARSQNNEESKGEGGKRR